MNIQTVKSILVIGEKLEYVLFNTAINCAKAGFPVWYISIFPFEKIPENIEIPEKDVLNLITFIYLKDYQCLISHLNGIHLWRKTPHVILIDKFDLYCNINEENYDPLIAALLSTSVLDASCSASRKSKRDIYLIITCKIQNMFERRLITLRNLYFPKIFSHSVDLDTVEALNDFIV
ncbi:uncharacterized protein LOC123310317 [Coccinella septempunctata]|uniref:uncharacterized protein LOC123310317 n=1 Tax=Coccinella septempunctata TaxID=41139 RepID=UPI001D07FC83|nr:uncharacterized protein LOC123310317 [Coccinella septempunctata]